MSELSVLWPLLGAVLVGSLLGSVHCAGMCGPFVAVCSAGASRRDGLVGQAAYHGGRLLTYVALGALAGGVGAAVDWAGQAAGLVHAAPFISGGLVLLSALGVLWPRLSLPERLSARLDRGLLQLGRRPRAIRGALLGVFTPVLPCGWLYAFVLSAAGTGQVVSGGLLMATFWLGTVPALMGVGLVTSPLGVLMRRRMPLLTAAVLVVIGLSGVITRAGRPLPASPAHARGGPSESARCH